MNQDKSQDKCIDSYCPMSCVLSWPRQTRQTGKTDLSCPKPRGIKLFQGTRQRHDKGGWSFSLPVPTRQPFSPSIEERTVVLSPIQIMFRLAFIVLRAMKSSEQLASTMVYFYVVFWMRKLTMNNSKRPLTTKQQQFALEYCVDFNGKQAAIRAGYKAERAADAAYKLLKNIRIVTLINRARQCRIQALEFRIDRIGAKQRARVVCSLADYFEIDADGTLRFKHLTQYEMSMLNNVDDLEMSDDGVVLGIKLKNPTKSLQHLMKVAESIDTAEFALL